MADVQDDELIGEFLAESYENLDRLDADLVELETDPTSVEHLGSIFRSIHTIKGTCGFLGFERLGAVAHSGENLLGLLREGTLRLDAERTSALLAMVDRIRGLLADVAGTGAEAAGDDSDLVGRLDALAREDVPPPAAVIPPPPVAELPGSEPAAPAAEADGESARPVAAAPADATVRVPVTLLDRMMDLVGELVLARNQVLQHVSSVEDATFISTAQRLNLVTSELQEEVTRARMQPIGGLWTRIPRVVRDLALILDKRVRVEMEGATTELDRTLIEAIKDPLTHMIRNAVDHGIESPAVREAAGKPAEGILRLRAFHEGGQVHMEITDDGGGIDPARMRSRAVQRGVLTPAQAELMSDAEAFLLIFAPGFSTAEAVSAVSGRGVGMDVVKTNIEQIGGAVEVESVVGTGTTVRIRIPLTLAIIPALTVESGGARYAIPQVGLAELVLVDLGQATTAISRVHDAPVLRLRDRLLPLVDLDEQLGLPSSNALAAAEGTVSIVVLQVNGTQFGLVVGTIRDTQEIVVKPLGAQLNHLSLYAGATIMGDGGVALILDVAGFAAHCGILQRGAEATRSGAAPDREPEASETTWLLLDVGAGRTAAVRLSDVARLESIPAAAVEHVGGRPVVQYGAQILSLVDVAGVLAPSAATGVVARGPVGARDAQIPVVVHRAGGQAVGLVVEEILDVVTASALVDPAGRGAGTCGAVVLRGRVTAVLDLAVMLAQPTAPVPERVPVGALGG